jgi:hypothetical protein
MTKKQQEMDWSAVSIQVGSHILHLTWILGN